MAVCPHCRHESGGRFFCDRCHTLLPLADSTPLPEQVFLPDGRAVDCSAFGGAFPADCWQPVEATFGDAPCRVYAAGPSWWCDLADVVGRRARAACDVLAPLEVAPVGEGAVVVARGLAGASRPLAEPPPPADAEPLARLDEAVAAAGLLARALGPLHRAGLLWLNFDPAGLLAAGGRVQVAGLDLRLFPAGSYPAGLPLSPLYSPPEVYGFRGDRLGPAADVFHAAAYLWYRLAGLPGGLPGGGLEAIDFEFPPLRIYNSQLPPGIAPVLARGLARDPADRFASADELAAALGEAADRARRRDRSAAAVRLDVGAATAAGKAHEVQGLPNQDAHLLAAPAPGTLVAIVADGVTRASGRGTGPAASPWSRSRASSSRWRR